MHVGTYQQTPFGEVPSKRVVLQLRLSDLNSRKPVALKPNRHGEHCFPSETVSKDG